MKKNFITFSSTDALEFKIIERARILARGRKVRGAMNLTSLRTTKIKRFPIEGTTDFQVDDDEIAAMAREIVDDTIYWNSN